MPIIEVPFERIGIDLVGPLLKTKSDFEYVLVVVDYATCYPKVVPLRNTLAKSIAQSLVQICCGVGLPKEVLGV